MKITLMFILLISLVSCATKIKDSELEEYEYYGLVDEYEPCYYEFRHFKDLELIDQDFDNW